ncbi:uncharacterized protein LOC134221698 [Armigeres subalbatus]|uniref:uncharacterized protein LOC134221698 n=1 Tax=Armigeres subalbatus TaxID=124917 RepID=UPI002ED612CC
MSRKVRKIKLKAKRNIEDVPFYKFVYHRDELPLDPARSFIEEQISKINVIKPACFSKDYSLHRYPRGDGQGLRELLLPEKLSSIETAEYLPSGVCSLSPLDKRLPDVTTELVKLYRFAIENFPRPSPHQARPAGEQVLPSLRPSESRWPPQAACNTPQEATTEKFHFDEFAYRTPEENDEALLRIQRHLDRMIAKKHSRGGKAPPAEGGTGPPTAICE